MDIDQPIANGLARRAREGDLVARDRLLSMHRTVIGASAKRYLGEWHHFAYDDLFQEGVVGLLACIATFPSGRDFTPWASVAVKYRMVTALHHNGRNVQMRGSDDFFYAVLRARSTLYHRLGRDPTLAEVVALSEVPAHKVGPVIAAQAPTQSFDVLETGAEDPALLKLFGEGTEDETEVAVERRLAILNPTEQQIIREHILGNTTLRQLSTELCLDLEHVRNLEHKALAYMRAAEEEPRRYAALLAKRQRGHIADEVRNGVALHYLTDNQREVVTALSDGSTLKAVGDSRGVGIASIRESRDVAYQKISHFLSGEPVSPSRALVAV